jgi:hypothetical protein
MIRGTVIMSKTFWSVPALLLFATLSVPAAHGNSLTISIGSIKSSAGSGGSPTEYDIESFTAPQCTSGVRLEVCQFSIVTEDDSLVPPLEELVVTGEHISMVTVNDVDFAIPTSTDYRWEFEEVLAKSYEDLPSGDVSFTFDFARYKETTMKIVTPTPEPDSILLLLTPLVVVGVIGKKRLGRSPAIKVG